jgi:hypothetical protein
MHMIIRQWANEIKSAKIDIEHAKSEYDKKYATHKISKLNEDFINARAIWAAAREARTKQWLAAYLAETNRVNSVLNELNGELLEAKKLAGIV